MQPVYVVSTKNNTPYALFLLVCEADRASTVVQCFSTKLVFEAMQ